MEILFYPERLHGLARSGVLRARSPADARVKTPVFVPMVHECFLEFPEYITFLKDYTRAGNQFLFLPALSSTRKIIDIFEQNQMSAGDLIFFQEQDNVRCSRPDNTIASFDIELPHGNVGLNRDDPSMDSLVIDTVRENLIQCPVSIMNIENITWLPRILDNCSSILNERGFGIYIVGFDPSDRNNRENVEVARLLHDRLRPDLLRVVSGTSSPSLLSQLVATGFDVILENGILADTARSIYYSGDQEFVYNDLQALPCACNYCKELQHQGSWHPESVRFQLLIYLHNLYETFHEMVRVRQRLRQGNFRELLEARSHHSPLTASFLKRLDGNTIDVVVHTTDLSWKSKLQFIGTDSYQRPEVNKFRYKVKRSFSFPARARFILLLPCSAGKPYSTSSSHVKFAKAMERGWRQWQQCGTEVIVTSPIGVVPRQLEACFPAAHYDVPVTGYWDEQEINFSREMLVSIINGSKRVQDGSIQLVIAHLDGGYRQSCEAAEKQLHVPILYTCDFSSVTSPPALKALENTMATAREKYGEAFARLPRVDTRLDDLRVLIDYQFDSNIGHHLLPDGTKTRLIHGNQLHAFDPAAKETLCRIDQDSGIVVLEKKGLERAWKAFQESPSIPLKRVTFCDKEMQGSNVFPVGIERVEPGIDAGDDVFIQDVDGNLLGYGRAVLPGFQMRQARGGPVVTIIKKL